MEAACLFLNNYCSNGVPKGIPRQLRSVSHPAKKPNLLNKDNSAIVIFVTIRAQRQKPISLLQRNCPVLFPQCVYSLTTAWSFALTDLGGQLI